MAWDEEQFNNALNKKYSIAQQEVDDKGAHQRALIPSTERIATMQYGPGGAVDRSTFAQYGPGGAYDRHAASSERIATMQRPAWEGEGVFKQAEAEGIRKLIPYSAYDKYLESREGELRFNRKYVVPGTPNAPGALPVSPVAAPQKKRPDWWTGKLTTPEYERPRSFLGSQLNFIPFQYAAGAVDMPFRAFDWARENLFER